MSSRNDPSAGQPYRVAYDTNENEKEQFIYLRTLHGAPPTMDRGGEEERSSPSDYWRWSQLKVTRVRTTALIFLQTLAKLRLLRNGPLQSEQDNEAMSHECNIKPRKVFIAVYY